MRALLIPPFLTLGSSEAENRASKGVETDHWSLLEEDSQHPLGEFLEGWDYARDLRLRRTLLLDIGAIRKQCGLGKDSTVRLLVEWRTQRAWTSAGVLHRQEVKLDVDASTDFSLEVLIPGKQLGGLVKLTTLITLGRRGTGARPEAAMRPGSILWSDSHDIALEGSGARMPVALDDFSHFSLEERNGGWTINLAPEWLEQHPSVGLQVLINSRHPHLVAAFSQKIASNQSLRKYLFYDVARMLLSQAFADEDFITRDYEQGTAGDALQNLLRASFPGLALLDIRERWAKNPLSFERLLQATYLKTEEEAAHG